MACSVEFGIVLTLLIFAMVNLIGVEFAPWIKYPGMDRAQKETLDNIFKIVFSEAEESKNDGDTIDGDIFGDIMEESGHDMETSKGLLFTCVSGSVDDCYRNEMEKMETYEQIALILMVIAGNLTVVALAASCGICCNCCRNKIPTVVIIVCSTLVMFFTLVSAIVYYTETHKMLGGHFELAPGFYLALVFASLMLGLSLISMLYLFTKGDLVVYQPKVGITHPLFVQEPQQPHLMDGQSSKFN